MDNEAGNKERLSTMETKSNMPNILPACLRCQDDPPFSEAQKLFLKEMQSEIIAAQNKKLEECDAKIVRDAASRKQLEDLVDELGKQLEKLETEVKHLENVGDGVVKQLGAAGVVGKLLTDALEKFTEVKQTISKKNLPPPPPQQ